MHPEQRANTEAIIIPAPRTVYDIIDGGLLTASNVTQEGRGIGEGMFERNLDRAIIASEVAEAVGNYARADEPLLDDARLTLSGRDGTYLLSADIAQPIWGATYGSPAEMRAAKGPELRLLEERVKEIMNGQDCIASLRRMLSDVETHADLKRLSEKAAIPFQRRSATGISHAEQVVRLVDAAVRSGQQQALLYAVKLEFPQ